MWKRALYTYFMAFRWSNLKKIYNFSNIWAFTYLLILAPINFSILEKDNGLAAYYFRVLPCALIMLNHLLVPLALQKKMFLCPMQQEERKEYVRCLLWIKLMVPMVFASVLLCLEMLFLRTETGYLWTTLVCIFSLNLSGSLYPKINAGYGGQQRRNYSGKQAAQVWNLLNIVISVVHLFLLSLYKLEKGQIPPGMEIYLITSVLIQLFWDFYIYNKNIASILQGAVDYENCFRLYQEVKEKK